MPLQLALGLPLVPEPLNELVCENAAVRLLCKHEHSCAKLLCIQERYSFCSCSLFDSFNIML